jgi:hypothetical protein
LPSSVKVTYGNNLSSFGNVLEEITVYSMFLRSMASLLDAYSKHIKNEKRPNNQGCRLGTFLYAHVNWERHKTIGR